ncbi:ParB/RepB/Spo0J family partition protein [Azohydromonas lata]|uniref:ParB/RepB/Spo0J family partition protein n=1 Tax=Azohydromonas lata TaxID=45677 RepID=A0ABU5IK70_9BURK|nr:ParB/RepB/Spo0J family partition protein [Azohydromonas lata]MDZ5459298.1 ParB/RepB/Spo0J family partition protein [Azohydromonas lata]
MTSKAASAATKPTGGFGKLGNLSTLLTKPSPASAAPAGTPLEISRDLIDPDPAQPRRDGNPGYSAESLGELADSIKVRGQKSPISVRANPKAPGRYFINHGERRWRACGLAGLSTVKAFIDNDFATEDQIIENLQRVDLTARELADWIGSRLAAGDSQADVARKLGKSRAFVTLHVTLLDLPDPIAKAFNSGRVSDVTVANELVRAYKTNAKAVSAWLSIPDQEITRGTVKALRAYMDRGAGKAVPVVTPCQTNEVKPDEEVAPPPATAPAPSANVEPTSVATSDASAPTKAARQPAPAAKQALVQSSDNLHKPVVRVVIDNRQAVLVIARRPSVVGRAWVCFDDDGQQTEVDLASVRLLAVDEAAQS